MKYIIAILILIVATCCFAAKPDRPRDGKGAVVEGFAPDGKKEAALTAASTTKDMTSDISWQVYCAGVSVFRTMSTATRAGVKHTIPATAWTGRNVNMSTPFLNISGCSGTLQRQ